MLIMNLIFIRILWI